MGKSKAPSIPEPPSFQANPYVDPNVGFLSSVGQSLARGGFMPGNAVKLPSGFEDVNLSFLNDLVTLNPEATQTAVDLASRDVIRMRDQAQQSILNELEANNQLTSSVTGNRLSDLNEAFSADISDIASQFYLADVERRMSNIANLFELGLNTTGQATNLGLADQQQQNQFNLANYSNQVAASVANQQESAGGGLLGGGLGSALGLGAGLLLAPATGGASALLAAGALGAGVGGALGAGVGGTLFPGSSNGTLGASYAGGSLGLAGLAAGNVFQPTNTFGGTAQADLGLNERLMLQNQRALGGVA